MRALKILENSLKAFPLLLLLLGGPAGMSQGINSIKLLDFRYGFQAPGGDMKDRFGGNNALGLGIEAGYFKRHLFFGAEGMYFFGNHVKEDVVKNLRSYDGNIIGINGEIGDVNLKERGYYAGLYAGKIFSTTKYANQLTGIRLQVGGGILQHKIRVQDNNNTIVPLEKKYLFGYDRLTNGPALRLGLGFQYDSPTNNFQFRIMGDLMAGFTKARRDLDFATGSYLGKNRTDLLYGLHVAYIVTISRTSVEEDIYY